MGEGQDGDTKTHGNRQDLCDIASRSFSGQCFAGADRGHGSTKDEQDGRDEFYTGIPTKFSVGFLRRRVVSVDELEDRSHGDVSVRRSGCQIVREWISEKGKASRRNWVRKHWD